MEGKNNRHCVACVRTPSIASFDKSSIKRISRTVGDPAPKCLNETQPHDVIMLFLPFVKELFFLHKQREFGQTWYFWIIANLLKGYQPQ